ncbi:MAG: metal-dependent transcriptional regulator [Candidatus Paceibacterota bacterium]
MRTIHPNSGLISSTKEDYLRAIYLLQESGKSTGVTKIADRLGLSKSSVSERIKELVKDELVIADPYTTVKLTEKGENLAMKLTYKHRLIEVFLSDVLKMSKNKIHAEAEKLEHACSDEMIKRLAKFLGNPKNDPHGSRLPKIKNWN